MRYRGFWTTASIVLGMLLILFFTKRISGEELELGGLLPFAIALSPYAWSKAGEIEKWGWGISSVAVTVLAILALAGKLEIDATELLGFVTGAICVWLCVKEDLLNWPIGIANSFFLLMVFWSAHLFADSSLQIVYIVLGALGWYWWLRGGKGQTELLVARTPIVQIPLLFLIAVIGTFFFTQFLGQVHDSSPFLDALTTILSLIAQYLLTRKLIENWGVWIVADIIYIGLYTSRHLYLTAILYFVFLCMCILGAISWSKSLQQEKKAMVGLQLRSQGV